MKTATGFLSLVLVTMGVVAGWTVPGHAMTVTALDITDGSVNHHGRFHGISERLLDQGGLVKMGEYQAIGEIVPSITKKHTTYSLFTSGFNGSPSPSATVDGSSITADLSSLFLAVSRGNSMRLWNIGGQATGTFDPQTSHFTLSWKDMWSHARSHEAAFVLEGTAIVGGVTTPVPIPASLALYVTGLLGLGSWRWLTRRQVGVA